MHILVVEDEAVLRESLVDGLPLAISGAVCHGCASVEDAREWMNPSPDVIISDVRLPGRSGIDFLLDVRKQSPSTRFILMTAFGETISEEQALAQGAIKFLHKPFPLKDLVKFVNECKTTDAFSGQLQGVSLIDLMQVLVMGKRSIQIEVDTKNGTGQIVILKGEVVHAQLGETTGEQAFFALVTQTAGHFNTRVDFVKPQTTLNTPFHFLVMEAMRLLDEGQLIEIDDAELVLNDAFEPSAPLPGMDLGALQGIDGFVGACVIKADDGDCVCSASTSGPSIIERVNDEARALQRMADSLKIKDSIEDVMFTLQSQCHLIRPIGGGTGYLSVMLERTKSNLGVARHLARTIDPTYRS